VYLLSEFESGSMFRASYLQRRKRLLMRLKISIALLLALAPSLAFARPRTVTAHMRPQLFRDRAPKAQMPDARVRKSRMSTVKTPTVVPQ
jgi:hypothetical protein